MYDVTGACDMHIHTTPDLADRVGDDFEVAECCQRAGYRAFLIKSHNENTASRAYHVRKHFPDIKAYGSITLNAPVGGLNPCAAEVALQMGAKEIFMPTSYALAHSKIHGKPGSYKDRKSTLRFEAEPITVLDGDGNLKPEVVTILELARDYSVPVGTAHLSQEEVFAIAKMGKDLKTKILITHPHFHPPNLPDEAVKALVALGAKVELCAGTVNPVPGYGRVEQVVSCINAVGYENFIISSDAGTPTKPMPPETLSAYLYCLLVKGIERKKLDWMFRDHPAELFEL
jgi:hypothetical protein